MAANHN
jgi:uncharacterized protein YjbI with pentapeptide repeats